MVWEQGLAHWHLPDYADASRLKAPPALPAASALVSWIQTLEI